MTEREVGNGDRLRNPSKLLIPTEQEIQKYLEEVAVREPFDSSDEIGEETKNVRLVSEEGAFLGFGETGRYDWFTKTHNVKGRKLPVATTLHHESSSSKYKMTTLRADFYIETDQTRSFVDILTA